MTQRHVLFVCAFLAIAIGSTWLRRRITDVMLFYPIRGQERTPRALGLEYEEYRVQASDGIETQYWWMPGPGPTVLFFHGNAGTMSDRLDIALRLHHIGAAVAFSEYRGYGESTGRPSEVGFYRDALAALEHTRSLAGARPIVVAGRSLGGAIAIELATKERVDGLVIESTFTSLSDIAGITGIPLAGRLVSYDFSSSTKIGNVEAPILITHGDEDELVPFAMGRALERAARDGASPDVQFHAIPGGGHNDILLTGGQAYWNTWKDFLDTVATEPSRERPGVENEPPTE